MSRIYRVEIGNYIYVGTANTRRTAVKWALFRHAKQTGIDLRYRRFPASDTRAFTEFRLFHPDGGDAGLAQVRPGSGPLPDLAASAEPPMGRFIDGAEYADWVDEQRGGK